MGDVVALAFGPIAIPGAGAFTFDYIHPSQGKPSKIGLIAAQLSAGTQTGKLEIRYGSDPTNACGIFNDAFTANEPCISFSPDFVIQPGQCIRLVFSQITAGDTLRIFIEGH